jgi:hypothetical protein
MKKALLDLKDVVKDVLALGRYESATRLIGSDAHQDLPLVVGVVSNSRRSCSEKG